MELDWFDLGLDDIALEQMVLSCLRLDGMALDKVGCLTLECWHRMDYPLNSLTVHLIMIL